MPEQAGGSAATTTVRHRRLWASRVCVILASTSGYRFETNALCCQDSASRLRAFPECLGLRCQSCHRTSDGNGWSCCFSGHSPFSRILPLVLRCLEHQMFPVCRAPRTRHYSSRLVTAVRCHRSRDLTNFSRSAAV